MGGPNELVAWSFNTWNSGNMTAHAKYASITSDFMEALRYAMENQIPWLIHNDNYGLITNIDFDRRQIDVTTFGSPARSYLVEIQADVVFDLGP